MSASDTSHSTIYARASASGRAGVAVFRISGLQVRSIMGKLVGKDLVPRQALLCRVRDEQGALLDEGLAIFFPAPNSFTGEDVLELQLHGSRAVELALYTRLSQLGAVLAEPGEFSLRALKNGKLDLTQIEGLGDLLDAETDLQRLQALGQFGGGLSSQAESWRGDLLAIMASLTADIDFSDEGDVPAAIASLAVPKVRCLLQSLIDVRSLAGEARQIREGLSIALVGAPNVGKSSLLNRLSGSDLAIVSDRPGTTRDVIEARLDIGGMLVCLADTAGLRDTGHDGIAIDDIEIEGMSRSRRRAEQADLRFLVLDAGQPEDDVSRETLALYQPGDFILLNKVDIHDGGIADQAIARDAVFRVSAKTGIGIDTVLDALASRLIHSDLEPALPTLTRQRHIDLVDQAIAGLERAQLNLVDHPELAAEDLRLASRSFNRLIGSIDVEEVLGEIFSKFCIGK